MYSFQKVQHDIRPHCLEKQSVLVSPALVPGPVRGGGGGRQVRSGWPLDASLCWGRVPALRTADPSSSFRAGAFWLPSKRFHQSEPQSLIGSIELSNLTTRAFERLQGNCYSSCHAGLLLLGLVSTWFVHMDRSQKAPRAQDKTGSSSFPHKRDSGGRQAGYNLISIRTASV